MITINRVKDEKENGMIWIVYRDRKEDAAFYSLYYAIRHIYFLRGLI